MSVIGWHRHISANGLQRTKENPELWRQVISGISHANSESPLILNVSELTSCQISILREVAPDLNYVCNRWTERDIENIEFLRNYNLELYEHIKSDLFQIVMDEKDCCYLEVGTGWDVINYVFRRGTLMEENIHINKIDLLYDVNIFYGKLVYPDDLPSSKFRLQEVNEVLEIAAALLTITESEIRQRFEKALQTQPRTYRPCWVEGSYPAILEACQEVQAFYETAANNRFGVFSDID
jgi:hypothetical protein